MCNDADQYVRVADRIVPTGTSLPPFARFGSLADKPSRSKIHFCPLWSKSGQTWARLDCPLSANSGHHRRSTNAASERLKADCELCPELRTLKIVKIQVEIGVGGRTTGDLWLGGRIESDLFIYLPQHCRSRVKGVPDIVVQPCGVKCRQVPHFNTRKQLR